MNKRYVYLDKEARRLLISISPITGERYLELLNLDGPFPHITDAICKVYCLGYIQGTQNGGVTNDVNEFK